MVRYIAPAYCTNTPLVVLREDKSTNIKESVVIFAIKSFLIFVDYPKN
jgi:hypothetical protein